MAYSHFYTAYDDGLKPAAFDSDGTALYEGEYNNLLRAIIERHDFDKLKQYVLNFSCRLLSRPADLIWCDPFWMAASYGNADIFRFLLEQYDAVQVDKKPLDQRGFSLLHAACRTGNVEVARLLLDSQPPLGTISARDKGDETPLLSAASSLFDFDLGDADDGDDSYRRHLDRISQAEELINLLLDRGACAQDSRYSFGNNDDDMNSQPLETVLEMAISRGSSALVKRLLDQGADPYIKHHFVYNILAMRFGHGDHDSFKDVNVLHMAALFWNADGIKALIDHHTNSFTNLVFSSDSNGHLPLHYAAVSEIVSESEIPDGEISRRLVDTFSLLLSGNPSAINARDEQGLTPLYYTVRTHASYVGSRHTELAIRVLLEHGADATISDSYGRTTLHLLARSPEPIGTVLLDLLTAHGADVNHADNDGNRPLHDLARNLCQTQAVTFLCSRGADISATNTNGDTAFHKAAEGVMLKSMEGKYEELTATYRISAQDEMMAVLQTASGGDEMMNQPNKAGKTPRDLQTETRSRWQVPIRGSFRGRGKGL